MNTGPQIMDDKGDLETNDKSHSHGGYTGNGEGLTNNGGKGNGHENRPPYYVLAFIMRIQ